LQIEIPLFFTFAGEILRFFVLRAARLFCYFEPEPVLIMLSPTVSPHFPFPPYRSKVSGSFLLKLFRPENFGISLCRLFLWFSCQSELSSTVCFPEPEPDLITLSPTFSLPFPFPSLPK
jgi:hypothetical protein